MNSDKTEAWQIYLQQQQSLLQVQASTTSAQEAEHKLLLELDLMKTQLLQPQLPLLGDLISEASTASSKVDKASIATNSSRSSVEQMQQTLLPLQMQPEIQQQIQLLQQEQEVLDSALSAANAASMTLGQVEVRVQRLWVRQRDAEKRRERRDAEKQRGDAEKQRAPEMLRSNALQRMLLHLQASTESAQVAEEKLLQ